MIKILIFSIIIAGVFSVFVSLEDGKEDTIHFNGEAFTISTVFVALFVFGVSTVIILCDSSYQTKQQTTDAYSQIVNLSVNSTSQGSFFIGTGQVDQQEYYYFYLKDGNSYKLNKIPAEGTDVVEDNNPRLEIKTISTFEKEIPGSMRKFFGVMTQDTGWSKSNEDQKVYILHVPKGSINQTYNLQLNSNK